MIIEILFEGWWLQTGVRDLSWFLQLKPLRLETKYIHIKTRVETYLNAAFYNHAAVALHNWKVGCASWCSSLLIEFLLLFLVEYSELLEIYRFLADLR